MLCPVQLQDRFWGPSREYGDLLQGIKRQRENPIVYLQFVQRLRIRGFIPLLPLTSYLFLLAKKAASVSPDKGLPCPDVTVIICWLNSFFLSGPSRSRPNIPVLPLNCCHRHQLSGADISVSLQLSHHFLWPTAAFTFRRLILVQVQQIRY
jgi:hypothetical protein